MGVGQIGQQPNLHNQQYQLSISASGRLKSTEEFAEIVIRTASDGSPIKLRDVGRVELGAENYGS